MSVAYEPIKFEYDPRKGTQRFDGGTIMVVGDGKAHRIEMTYPADFTIGDGGVTARFLRADGVTVTWAGIYPTNVVTTGEKPYIYTYLPVSCYAVKGHGIFSMQIDSTDSASTYHDVTACIIDFTVSQVTTTDIVNTGQRIPSLSEIATAAENTNRVAGAWENATATATTLPTGSEATVTITGTDVKNIAFGIPRGATGASGALATTLSAFQSDVLAGAPNASCGSLRECIRRMFIPVWGANGTAGQVLTLTSAPHDDNVVDFLGWKDVFPANGTAGQVLSKSASGTAWKTLTNLSGYTLLVWDTGTYDTVTLAPNSAIETTYQYKQNGETVTPTAVYAVGMSTRNCQTAASTDKIRYYQAIVSYSTAGIVVRSFNFNTATGGGNIDFRAKMWAIVKLS